MTRNVLTLALAMGLIAVSGCNQNDRSADAAKGAAAVKEAGDKTIAAGIDEKSRFFTLAKAAGLDATLAGPGPIPCSSPTTRPSTNCRPARSRPG